MEDRGVPPSRLFNPARKRELVDEIGEDSCEEGDADADEDGRPLCKGDCPVMRRREG